jgi:hypothetical protein
LHDYADLSVEVEFVEILDFRSDVPVGSWIFDFQLAPDGGGFGARLADAYSIGESAEDLAPIASASPHTANNVNAGLLLHIRPASRRS